MKTILWLVATIALVAIGIVVGFRIGGEPAPRSGPEAPPAVGTTTDSDPALVLSSAKGSVKIDPASVAEFQRGIARLNDLDFTREDATEFLAAFTRKFGAIPGIGCSAIGRVCRGKRPDLLASLAEPIRENWGKLPEVERHRLLRVVIQGAPPREGRELILAIYAGDPGRDGVRLIASIARSVGRAEDYHSMTGSANRDR